jgi:HlyD family secretion protein
MTNTFNERVSNQVHEDAQQLVLTSQTPAITSDDWSDVTQESLDSLPQVWTRGLLYLLVVFVSIVLPWAMLSKVDETGTAKGRLEPQSKMRLDAPVAGRVVAIKVKEGETVKAGQTLLELDSERARTELEQTQAKLEGLVDRSNTLELVKNKLQTEQQAQLDQIQQRLNSSQETYAIQKRSLTLAQKNVQRYKKLRQQGVIAQVKLEETENALLEQQRLSAQTQLNIKQARSELKKQETTYQRQLDEHQSQIVGMRSEIAQNQSQIKSLNFQLSQRELKAPESGTVFQLPIKKAGAVVQLGALVAEIAPQGSPLVIRAQMPTTESGFLEEGLSVKLKFDAYPFQDYGVVEGKLVKIPPTTSIEADTPNDKTAVYNLEIALNQHCIPTKTKCIGLRPGETATAEVIVRQRRLIDFILDPFKKLQEGGLKL